MFKLEETPEEREYLVKFTYITKEDVFVHFSEYYKKTDDYLIRPVRFNFKPEFVKKIENWDDYILVNEKDNFFTDLLFNHESKSYVTFQKEKLESIPETFWDNKSNTEEFVRLELLKLNNIIEKKIQEYNHNKFETLYYTRFVQGMGHRDYDYNLTKEREFVDKLKRIADKLYFEFQTYKDYEAEFNFLMAKREHEINLEKLQIKRIEGELSMLIEEDIHHNLYYAFLDKKRHDMEKNVSQL